MESEKYIGKYVFDWKKLQPCDIVLSRESLSMDALLNPTRLWDVAKSGAIRLGSKHYSHAMLYVNGSILHAHPPMVFAVNPQRLSAAHADDYVCLRFEGLTADQKRKIEEYARSQVGALYSVREAAKTAVMKSGGERDVSGVEFCSRLVAEAYEHAGVSLVSNCSYCAPGDFLSVKSLTNLGACTRLAGELDIKILESPDFVLQSQERTFKLLEGVRDMAKKDNFRISTINSVFDYVWQFPHRDSDVCRLLNESRYLETWKDDAAAHGYRYEPFAMLKIRVCQPGDFRNEVVSLFDCAGRYGDELLKLDLIKCGLKTIDAIADLYRDMQKDIRRRVACLVMLYVQQLGVGPLSNLYRICDHLVEGTYSLYYSLPVRDQTAKLKSEWEQQIGMSN